MGPPPLHHLSHHPGHRGSERQSPAAVGSDSQTLLKFVEVTVPSGGRVDSCTAPVSIRRHTAPGEGSGTRPWRGGGAQLLPTQGPRWGSVMVLLIRLRGRLKLPHPTHTPRRRPDSIKSLEPSPTGTVCHEAHLGHQRPQAAAGNGGAGRYRGKAPSSSNAELRNTGTNVTLSRALFYVFLRLYVFCFVLCLYKVTCNKSMDLMHSFA